MDEFQENKNLSEKAIANLSRTVLWMKIMSIFLFLICALCVVRVIFLLTTTHFSLYMLIPIACIVMLGASAIYLIKAAGKYELFCISRKQSDLETAFTYQKIFWQIFVCVSVLSFLLFFLLTMTMSQEHITTRIIVPE